ncbi:MAG: MlaA family lipoprotein [Candidatus Binatia bacterium]
MTPPAPVGLRLGLALLVALLAGCAGKQPPRPDHDPWETMNRKVFWFNEQADDYVLEPTARGWDYVVPDPVQRSLVHFFANLRFPVVFVNCLLQAKWHDAASSVARFQMNTFMGGLGFYDLAADFGVPPLDEDFGQTLGVWDVAPGPYLVLPLVGPSGVRDTFGKAGDFAVGFYTYFVPVPFATLGLTAIDIVNARARLLDTVESAKEASLDFYVAARNAYVQRRWKLIHDGVPPRGAEEEELYDAEVFEVYPGEDDDR